MIDGFDAFPDLRQSHYRAALEAKTETKRTVDRMAASLKTACVYFCEHTKTGYTGNYLMGLL